MEGIDKNTFKRIFYDHWDAFKQSRPRFDNPDYNETVNKMLGCGDPDKMGFVQYRCCYCGEIRRNAFTSLRCLRLAYGPQRNLLQMLQLRQLNGMLVDSKMKS
jgi:hypothetical protein